MPGRDPFNCKCVTCRRVSASDPAIRPPLPACAWGRPGSGLHEKAVDNWGRRLPGTGPHEDVKNGAAVVVVGDRSRSIAHQATSARIRTRPSPPAFLTRNHPISGHPQRTRRYLPIPGDRLTADGCRLTPKCLSRAIYPSTDWAFRFGGGMGHSPPKNQLRSRLSNFLCTSGPGQILCVACGALFVRFVFGVFLSYSLLGCALNADVWSRSIDLVWCGSGRSRSDEHRTGTRCSSLIGRCWKESTRLIIIDWTTTFPPVYAQTPAAAVSSSAPQPPWPSAPRLNRRRSTACPPAAIGTWYVHGM